MQERRRAPSGVAHECEALTTEPRGDEPGRSSAATLGSDDRGSAGLEIVAVDSSRRHAVEDDEARTHRFRRQRKLRHGGSQGRRSDGRCPAQHAAVMIAMLLRRSAWLPVRWDTEPRRHGAAFDPRSAVSMMMQNRDRKLHAESYQRQPD